jgi:RNA-dependent RNA polymerase
MFKNTISGTVIVTKMPCLHPGDVRKLKAVSSPALEPYIRDCIVFSVQGYRPNCNEMAGSDLDGDQYWVYWGDEIEIGKVVNPLLYPAATKAVVNNVTNELIVDNVLDTFTNNIPGIISNTHKVISDKHDRHTFSKEAEECAKLFARAIDARKTGENISLDRIKQYKSQYCQTYPGWMMKFDKPLMDPPSRSINEILHQNAVHVRIHPDNYEDVIRPLRDAEYPVESVTIDMGDEEEKTKKEGGYCSRTVRWLFSAIIFALIVYFLVYKYKILK